MKNEIAAAKIKTRQREREQSLDSARSGIDGVSKGSIIIMGAVSAVIGLWAIACFVGAALSSNSPLAMFGGWFRAIMGM